MILIRCIWIFLILFIGYVGWVMIAVVAHFLKRPSFASVEKIGVITYFEKNQKPQHLLDRVKFAEIDRLIQAQNHSWKIPLKTMIIHEHSFSVRDENGQLLYLIFLHKTRINVSDQPNMNFSHPISSKEIDEFLAIFKTHNQWPLVGKPGKQDNATRYNHSVDFGTGNTITMLANGNIKGVKGASWQQTGHQLEIRWPRKDAPGGVWIDHCVVSADGYIGSNQHGMLIRGIRLK